MRIRERELAEMRVEMEHLNKRIRELSDENDRLHAAISKIETVAGDLMKALGGGA